MSSIASHSVRTDTAVTLQLRDTEARGVRGV